MRLGEQSVLIKNSETIDDVSADSVVNVLRVKLSSASLSVGRPVREVTNNFVISRQSIVEWPESIHKVMIYHLRHIRQLKAFKAYIRLFKAI